MNHHLVAIVVACLVLAGCAGTPTTPVAPTAPPAGGTPTAGIIASPPPAGTPSSPAVSSPGGGGTATVTVGGETYQLVTGDPPLCMLAFGVQVGMHSEDRQTSLTVHALGDLDAFNFALITSDDRWVPAEGSSRFQVAGSQASWSGTLVGQHTDRQEPGAIEIVCGG